MTEGNGVLQLRQRERAVVAVGEGQQRRAERAALGSNNGQRGPPRVDPALGQDS